MRLDRPSLPALGFGLLLLVAAGCSEADDTVKAEREPGVIPVPAGAGIVDVVAGPSVGWLFTVGGDVPDGEVAVWRVDPSGEARTIATLERRSGSSAAVGDGLVVARTTCSEAGPDCVEDASIVDVFDSDGEHVGGIEGAPPSGAGAESTARVVPGRPTDKVWVDVGDRFVRLDAQGREVDSAERRPGVPCAVDGRLVVVDPPSAAGSPTSDRWTAEDPGSEVVQASFTAYEWSDGRWMQAGGTTVEASAAEAGCVSNGAAVVDLVELETPVALWTSDNGWVPRPHPDESFAPGLGGVLRATSGQVFAVDPEGALVVRDPETLSFAPVDTDLRVPLQTEGPPPGITIDQSEGISLACTWSIGVEDGAAEPATCKIRRRS